MGHYDSCYEADAREQALKDKGKLHFRVTLEYCTPHLNGAWSYIRGSSISDVWDKLNKKIKLVMKENPHIKRYHIDDFKFYFNYSTEE